jgi:transposase
MLEFTTIQHEFGATDMNQMKAKLGSKKAGTCIIPVYVGLDYHDESIRVCLVDEEGSVIANRSVPNRVSAVIDFVRVHGGLVRVGAIEACCGASDFVTRLIDATDWEIRMAHAGAVSQLKKSKDKTDHGDAWLLADLVRVGYLPEVWLADHQTRQLRRLVRYRQGLVDQKKAIKLRIRSLLREERMEEGSEANAWSIRWMTWIKTVPLAEHSRWVLDEELRQLEEMERNLALVEKRMEEATKTDEVVQKLIGQPGIGLVTAVTMRAVIGRFDRFQTGKQLARYCGVTPCNASSGKRQADAGLISTGNDVLRPMLIQLAKRLPRLDPHWREYKSRMRVTKGANVASAAIANRWVRRLHHQMVPRPEEVG